MSQLKRKQEIAPTMLPLAAAPKVRKRRTKSVLLPTPAVSGASPIASNGDSRDYSFDDAQSSAVPAGVDLRDNVIHKPDVHSATIDKLVTLQGRRKFCIVEKNRSERAIESFIAGKMGFALDADEKDRKAVFARAKAYRLSVEKAAGECHTSSDAHSVDALSEIADIVAESASSREMWVTKRERAEKEMREYVKDTPVYEFAESVRGFGALGLAVILAEAGNTLSNYPTVAKLWKRMGLAVFDGQRQRRVKDKEDAIRQGYSPRRRAEVWAFCSDTMFRAQIRGDKDEDGKNPVLTAKPVATPGHALGPYGEVYLKRKTHTTPRIAATADLPDKAGGYMNPEKWTKMRCHNDARRVMSKALLRDIWRVWNGQAPRGAAEIADV